MQLNYSNTLNVTTNTIPISMNALTLVECDPQSIDISWPELTDMTANGGDVPNFY